MRKLVFSTADLPTSLSHEQRAKGWAETLTNAGGWDADCPNPDGFSASSALLNLPGVNISLAQATSIRLTRAHRHIQRDGNDWVMVVLNDGRTAIGGSQAGHTQELRSGDAMVLDFSMPHISHAIFGGKALAAHISRRLYDDMAGASAHPGGQIIDRSSEALVLLRSYLRLVLDGHQPINPAVGEATARHIVELVGLALGNAASGAPSDGNLGGEGAARVAMILNAISRRFAEPGLDADIVGRPIGLSGRSVQALLQLAGTTFTAELREARMKCAEAMLKSIRHANVSVTRIAHECGFVDLSTFNRTFRGRFHCTPSEMRAMRQDD